MPLSRPTERHPCLLLLRVFILLTTFTSYIFKKTSVLFSSCSFKTSSLLLVWQIWGEFFLHHSEPPNIKAIWAWTVTQQQCWSFMSDIMSHKKRRVCCQGLKWASVVLYFISFFFWNNTGTATAVQKLWLRCFDIYPVKVQMLDFTGREKNETTSLRGGGRWERRGRRGRGEARFKGKDCSLRVKLTCTSSCISSRHHVCSYCETCCWRRLTVLFKDQRAKTAERKINKISGQ